MTRLEEFIQVMEKYSYFSMDNKFTPFEILNFLKLMNQYSDYLLDFNYKPSMRSINSTIKILIKMFDTDFNISDIEFVYHSLKSEHKEVKQTIDSTISSFYTYCLPTIRDMKLQQLIG